MKKRGAIYSVVALMLCMAVYLNWYYTKTDAPPEEYQADGKVLGESILVSGLQADTKGPDDAEYFAKARLSRQQARDEAVGILTRTAESETASEEARAAANTDIQVMADAAVVEARIENLLIAKGYQDCVTFVNPDGVNVIVAKGEAALADADVARIRDVVLSETEVTAEAIKIIETDAK